MEKIDSSQNHSNKINSTPKNHDESYNDKKWSKFDMQN